MLIVALVLAVIGLAALVTAVVTSNELIAWVCIAASVIGVLLLIDGAHDLGMLALGVGLQRVGLLLGLPQLRFGAGLSIGQHRVGTLPGLGHCGLRVSAGLADHRIGLRTRCRNIILM